MSDEDHFAGRFEWERIVRRCRLRPLTKYVGMVLAQYANSDGTNAFPSVAKLARVTGLSERSVRNALSDMRSTGLIKRVQKGGLRGTQAIPDVHCLVIPADLLERVELLTPGEDEPPNRQEVPVGDGPNRHVVPPNRQETTAQPAPDDSPTGTTCLLPMTTYLPDDNNQDHLSPLVQDVTTRGDDDSNLYARLAAFDELDAARQRRKGA